MKLKQSLVFLLGTALSLPAMSQGVNEFCNTIPIKPSYDSTEIIRRSVFVVPTPNQSAAQKDEFIAFIHFGPNTFTRREWGTGLEDPKIFDLKKLDTDQWCEAMKAAGMKKVILTAKHHDGFVLWQSRYTKHGIMSTNFQNGQGDVMRDLAASCRKYGLKLGVYLSPADLYQIENPEGLYGNLSKYTMRTIPREVPGRPFTNKTKFEFLVDDYNEYFLNQLFELLTEYGPISEVWFDGAHPKRKGGQTYNYAAWKKLIRTLAPNAVIFGREDIRWCGNEAGATRATEWNVIPYAADPDTMTVFGDMTADDLGSDEKLLHARYLHYQPAETNTSIREGWFYRDDTEQKVRSADDVFDIYERAVGGNSIFLLNIPPNREGRFSPTDVAVLKEVGQRIRETYSDNLLKGAKGPVEMLDDDPTTFTRANAFDEMFEIRCPKPITINRFVVQEAVDSMGERVKEHQLEALIDGRWKVVARATNIGYKRILRFPDITTNRLRLHITKTRYTSAIATVAAYHYDSRPPLLSATRDRNGIVTITARDQNFGWKSNGQNAAENLNKGYRIFYSTKRSAPKTSSPEYTAPFMLDNKELKAVAFLNGRLGTVLRVRFGYVKTDWKVSARTDKTVTIDLGGKKRLRGFAFTPAKHGGQGTVAGRVFVSTDGKKWKEATAFELSNLINDPTRRTQNFKRARRARYVRFEVPAIAAKADEAVIYSIDLY